MSPMSGPKARDSGAEYPLNCGEINFQNGFLDAFNTTRSGGDAKLFDRNAEGTQSRRWSRQRHDRDRIGGAARRIPTLERLLPTASRRAGRLSEPQHEHHRQGRRFRLETAACSRRISLCSIRSSICEPLHSNPGSSTYHSLQVQSDEAAVAGFLESDLIHVEPGLGENDDDSCGLSWIPRTGL